MASHHVERWLGFLLVHPFLHDPHPQCCFWYTRVFPFARLSVLERWTNLKLIWTHGESFRFVTARPATIIIREVKFTPGTTSTEVETLSVPDSVRSAMPSTSNCDYLMGWVIFLPAPCQLAIAHDGKVLVWDSWNSIPLLSCTDAKCHQRMSFSPDGRLCAYSTAGSEIHLWKKFPTGYILWRGMLTFSAMHPSPLLSPNGESIVVFGGRSTCSWRTKGFATTPSSLLPRGR